MNNNEILTFPIARGKVALWVPSDWVNLTVLHWPGKLHRYRVWQHLREQPFAESPFNFSHVFDPAEQTTWVSVFQLQAEKWSLIPEPLAKVALLTAPKAMAQGLLPRHRAPFTLLAYRWRGQVELCGYRLGVLQLAQRGEAVSSVYSRVIQAMPVLAAAPLYTWEDHLTQRFNVHHGVCHTLTSRQHRLVRCFLRETGEVN